MENIYAKKIKAIKVRLQKDLTEKEHKQLVEEIWGVDFNTQQK